MNKKNNLASNMISYALMQVVNMLVGIVLPRMYLLVYGSEVNGIISTVNSFISYFSYLEAGLGLTLIHSLFKPLAENDTESLSGILSFSKRKYKNISLVYFILVIVMSLIFPIFQYAESINKTEFAALVFVIGAYGAVDFYTMAKYRVLLTADRKEYVISYAMIIAQLIRFVLVWSMLKYQISVVFVKTVPILTLLIRSALLKIYVSKVYCGIDFSVKEYIEVESVSNRWDALFLQISINTSSYLPTVIVSQFLGFKEANVYAVYAMIVNALILLVSALSSGISPMFGKKIVKGEDIKNIYNLYDYIITIAITAIFAVTSIMIVPFVELYTKGVNDVNYIHFEYALLFSVWAVLYAYRMSLTAIINAAALYRETRVNNIVNLLIQGVAGIAAAYLFKIPGVLIVMIIAALHRNIGFISCCKGILGDGCVKKNIIRQIFMIMIITVACSIGNYYISNIEFTFVSWVVTAAVVTLLVAAGCILVFFAADIKTVKSIVFMLREKVTYQQKGRT